MQSLIAFLRRHGWFVATIIVFIGLGIYYLATEGEPTTSDAFVIAKIRPVAPRVSGYIKTIDVSNNQIVKKGQLLFSLDPKPFEIALNIAEINLKRGQNLTQELQLQLKADQKLIQEKKLAYDTVQYNVENAKTLLARNDFPEAKLKNLQRSAAIALAAYQAVTLKYQIDQKNYNNAQLQLKQDVLTVESKKLQLSYTKIYALSDGSVNNLNLAIGSYVKAGEPLFAFVNTTQWWVQANLKETQLKNVKSGDKAEIHLRMYPNQKFQGVIEHIAWGVQRQLTDTQTFLSKVVNENQWFLLPQRFPVTIRLTQLDQTKYPLHVGASATVRVLTQ